MWPNASGWCSSPCGNCCNRPEYDEGRQGLPIIGVSTDDPLFDLNNQHELYNRPVTPRAGRLPKIGLTMEKHSITITTTITTKGPFVSKDRPPEELPELWEHFSTQKPKRPESPRKRNSSKMEELREPPQEQQKEIDLMPKEVPVAKSEQEPPKKRSKEPVKPAELPAKKPVVLPAKKPVELKVPVEKPVEAPAAKPVEEPVLVPEKKAADFPQEDNTVPPVPPLKQYHTLSSVQQEDTKLSLGGVSRTFAESAVAGTLKCCVITNIASILGSNGSPTHLSKLPYASRKQCSLTFDKGLTKLSVVDEVDKTHLIDVQKSALVLLTGQALKSELMKRDDGDVSDELLSRIVGIKISAPQANIETLKSKDSESFVILAFYNVKDAFVTGTCLRLLCFENAEKTTNKQPLRSASNVVPIRSNLQVAVPAN